jgi:uncharacterized protein YaeQ
LSLAGTLHHFAISLSDVDRGVYETLELKIARHPSEAPDHLVARVLAYCLELTDGLDFSRGLWEPDEPALRVRDLTGRLSTWIDVGAPDAARLHKAAKAAPRVAVYTHKPPAQLLRQLEGQRIHRGHEIELYALDRELVSGLAARLERRVQFDLSVTDRHLFVSIDGATLSAAVERLRFGERREG